MSLSHMSLSYVYERNRRVWHTEKQTCETHRKTDVCDTQRNRRVWHTLVSQRPTPWFGLQIHQGTLSFLLSSLSLPLFLSISLCPCYCFIFPRLLVYFCLVSVSVLCLFCLWLFVCLYTCVCTSYIRVCVGGGGSMFYIFLSPPHTHSPTLTHSHSDAPSLALSFARSLAQARSLARCLSRACSFSRSLCFCKYLRHVMSQIQKKSCTHSFPGSTDKKKYLRHVMSQIFFWMFWNLCACVERRS